MVRIYLRFFSFLFLVGIFVGCDADAFSYDYEEQSIVTLFYKFNGTISVEKTDIIATSGNNILKIIGNDLAMSYDLGNTWKYLENSIGIISTVHWFKDQSCLICGRTKAYWVDSSFSKIHQSTVFDFEGNVLDDNSPHFFRALRGHDDYMTIAGKEVLIWPDYFGEVDGYVSRIWYTEDCGKTIRCICKNNSTKTADGQLIKCRHFHDCIVREGHDEIYITSGDVDDQCVLLKGSFSDGKWQYSILGQGSLFKFGSIYIDEPYLYLFCDYTGYGQTGILKVSIPNASDFTKYEYVYTCSDNLPIVKSFKVGKYSFYTYDGSVQGKVLYSYDSEPYRRLPVMFKDGNSNVSFFSNPNNAGLVLVRKGSGYNITDLKLNNCMYNFTDGMRTAGFSDFGVLEK